MQKISKIKKKLFILHYNVFLNYKNNFTEKLTFCMYRKMLLTTSYGHGGPKLMLLKYKNIIYYI